MVNKAISQRVETVQDERIEKSKEVEAQKKANEATVGWPKVLTQVSGQPNFITFLHDFDKGLNLSVHKVWVEGRNGQKGRYKPVICRKQYVEQDPDLYSKCPICESKSPGGFRNNPSLVRAFLGYVHNIEGQTYTPEAKPGKETKTYNLNPIKVIEVRFGQGSLTINSLKDYVRKGLFNKKIYQQIKMGEGKETQYFPLQIADPDVMGEECSKKVPKAVLEEYSSLTEDQIAQRILNAYEGVIWPLWEVEPPSEHHGNSDGCFHVEPEESAPDEETKGSARNTLG